MGRWSGSSFDVDFKAVSSDGGVGDAAGWWPRPCSCQCSCPCSPHAHRTQALPPPVVRPALLRTRGLRSTEMRTSWARSKLPRSSAPRRALWSAWHRRSAELVLVWVRLAIGRQPSASHKRASACAPAPRSHPTHTHTHIPTCVHAPPHTHTLAHTHLQIHTRTRSYLTFLRRPYMARRDQPSRPELASRVLQRDEYRVEQPTAHRFRVARFRV